MVRRRGSYRCGPASHRRAHAIAQPLVQVCQKNAASASMMTIIAPTVSLETAPQNRPTAAPSPPRRFGTAGPPTHPQAASRQGALGQRRSGCRRSRPHEVRGETAPHPGAITCPGAPCAGRPHAADPRACPRAGPGTSAPELGVRRLTAALGPARSGPVPQPARPPRSAAHRCRSPLRGRRGPRRALPPLGCPPE